MLLAVRVKCSMFYRIKIKTTTDLYRFIRLRFDKITDVRNMQIFDKVYQTGVSGDLRCCTYFVLYICIHVAPWSSVARHLVPLYVHRCSGMTIKIGRMSVYVKIVTYT